ncbi:hypothetical protein [Enhygromyxa salina]|nr:hypothetical protein [Enhygromyxa salina]
MLPLKNSDSNLQRIKKARVNVRANEPVKAIARMMMTACYVAAVIFDILLFVPRVVAGKLSPVKRPPAPPERYNMDPEEEAALKQAIEDSLEACSQRHQWYLTADCKKRTLDRTFRYYCRSKRYYAPVLLLWADYLLKKASLEKRKLCFLARDGIPPYEVAKILLKKYPERYPETTEDHCKLLWISREVVDRAYGKEKKYKKSILKRYLRQVGIDDADTWLYIDTGCTASRRHKILDMLGLDFYNTTFIYEFLTSRNSTINGFLDSNSYALPGICFPMAKQANYWLEDTHQTNKKRARTLLPRGDRLVPSSEVVDNGTHGDLIGEMTDNPEEFMLRKWSFRSLLDFAHDTDPHECVFEEARARLNYVLLEIQKGNMETYLTHN